MQILNCLITRNLALFTRFLNFSQHKQLLYDSELMIFEYLSIWFYGLSKLAILDGSPDAILDFLLLTAAL